MKPIIDISNLDMPVAAVLRQALTDLPTEMRSEVLEKMSEPEFVHYRVGVYLDEIERALLAGYTPAGAEELALKESMAGLTAT